MFANEHTANESQQQQASQWQPTLAPDAVQSLIQRYNQAPASLSQQQIDTVKEHAKHYEMPFYDGDFTIVDAVKQLGTGFLEGFTTIKKGEDPDNEYEAIARNIGHLIGFAPGILAKPLAFANYHKFARLSTQLNKFSVPMGGASLIQKGVGKLGKRVLGSASVGRSGAVKAASDFLMGGKISHIAEGAFHLGTASAISSWHGGIDEMMDAFIGGAQTGGMFRVIGNFVNVGNPKGNMLVRGLAGSMMMGMPSTMSGATTPEQVYEYLMGAYFGSNEISAARARSYKFIENKLVKAAKKDPELRVSMDPKAVPEFHNLSPREQELVVEETTRRYDSSKTQRAAQYELAKLAGHEKEVLATDMGVEGFQLTKEFRDGEEIATIVDAEGKSYDRQMITTGETGAADAFSRIGKLYGFPSVFATFPDQKSRRFESADGFQLPLNEAQLAEAMPHVQKANKSLKLPLTKIINSTDRYKWNAIRRGYFQIKDAEAVYGVGLFEKTLNGRPIKERTQVKGNSKWTVQMAIDRRLPIHIFAPDKKGWYSFNYSTRQFAPLEKGELPPKPPKRFAAVGTKGYQPDPKKPRKIFPASAKQAIHDLFDKYYVYDAEIAKELRTAERKQAREDEKTASTITEAEEQELMTNIMNRMMMQEEIAAKEEARTITKADYNALNKLTSKIANIQRKKTRIANRVQKRTEERKEASQVAKIVDEWAPKAGAVISEETAQNAILSNYHETPFTYQGKEYRTAQSAFEAFKTGEYMPGFERLTGAEAVELGALYESNRTKSVSLMRKILEAKYEASPEFREALHSSKDFKYPVKDAFWSAKFPELLKHLKQSKQYKRQSEFKLGARAEEMASELEAVRDDIIIFKDYVKRPEEIRARLEEIVEELAEAKEIGDKTKLYSERARLKKELAKIPDTESIDVILTGLRERETELIELLNDQSISDVAEIDIILGSLKENKHEYTDAQQEAIKNLTGEIEKVSQDIVNIREQSRESGGSDLDALETALESLTPRLLKMLNDRKLLKNTVEERALREEQERAEERDSYQDLDNEVADNAKVEGRAVRFIDDFFPKEFFTSGIVSKEAANRRKKETAQGIYSILRKYITHTKENKVADLAEELESKYGVALKNNPDALGALRQWLTMRNQNHMVKHFLSTPYGITEMKGSGKVVTGAGTRKDQVLPKSLLEEKYEEAGGEGAGFGLLDHITVKDDMGNPKDSSPSRFREQAKGQQYQQWLSTIMNKLWRPKRGALAIANKKTGAAGLGGWYIYGGKGDKDQLLMARFHPRTAEDFADVNSQFEALTNTINKTDKTFLKYAKEAQDSFVTEYSNNAWEKGALKSSDALHLFRKSFNSNIFYDLALNGFDPMTLKGEPLRKALAQITGDGFIKNSAGFNKRGQIWFTTSWPGDVSEIRKHVPDLYTEAGDRVKNNIIWNRNAGIIEREVERAPNEFVNFDQYLDSAGIDASNPSVVKRHLKIAEAAAVSNGRILITSNDIARTFAPMETETLSEFRKAVQDSSPSHYKYLIARDLDQTVEDLMGSDKFYSWDIKRKNSELGENLDGAIIIRDDAVDGVNFDFGMPKSGQNKSFIISNVKNHITGENHGALLGKFMFHAAGPEMSKMMKEKGLHMIMQESAVKQRGTRERSDYEVKNGQLQFDEAKTYLLHASDVKGNFSVKQSEHMLENQQIPKQVLSSLVALAKTPIKQEIIDEMFDSIVGERYRGTEEANKLVEDYAERILTENSNSKDMLRLERDILRNIDDIGIPTLIEMVKDGNATSLASTLYAHMMRINQEGNHIRFAEGEVTAEAFADELSNWKEYSHVTDEFINLSLAKNDKSRALGEDISALPTLLHPYVNKFREEAVKNFIVKNVTRPKMKNSVAAVMRPYDKALRMDLDKANPELKLLEGVIDKDGKLNQNVLELESGKVKADEIFFLDEHFRNRKISHDIMGVRSNKLGELWDMYIDSNMYKHAPDIRKQFEDLFRAVTVRVPMDSISGAQVLNFRGFTGRKGHGILLHARAMKAEGGADLDGDKSFVFFGGKGGFKERWKEPYYSNKDEFYFPEKVNGVKTGRTLAGDNKDSVIPEGVSGSGNKYRDILAFSPSDDVRAALNSKAFSYSPGERTRISAAAVDGRNQLAPASTMKQVMASTYNALMNTERQTDNFTVAISVPKKGSGAFDKKSGTFKKEYQKKFFNVIIQAKYSEQDLQHQRNMARAMIGLGSDPMDELGLKGRNVWFKQLWDSYFSVIGVTKTDNYGKTKPLTAAEKDWFNPSHKEYKLKEGKFSQAMNNGLYKRFKDINDAYWGRDWVNNRPYDMSQIQEKGAAGWYIKDNPELNNTFLSKTGVILAGADWSDSIIKRINVNQTKNMWELYNSNIKKYEFMKPLLDRITFKVTHPKYAHIVKKFGLDNEVGFNEVVSRAEEFKEVIKGTQYAYLDNIGELTRTRAGRREIIKDLVNKANDFISNDIQDMISTNIISDILIDAAQNEKEAPLINGLAFKEAVRAIFDKTEHFKSADMWARKERNKLETLVSDLENFEPTDSAVKKLHKRLLELVTPQRLDKLIGRPQGDSKDKATAAMDQQQMDINIAEYKASLSASGKELFDAMMLGTLKQGNLKELNNLTRQFKTGDRLLNDMIHHLRMLAAGTAKSRTGYSSREVDQMMKERFIYEYDKMLSPIVRMSEADASKTVDTLDKLVANKKLKEEGIPDPVEVELPDMIVKGLIEPTGFEYIKEGKEGKLDPELKSTIASIAEQINARQDYARALPLIVRGLFEKDLNVLNRQDFMTLDRYLKDLGKGTFTQRMIEYFQGHRKAGTLGWRTWLQFPKAVSQELMRDIAPLQFQKGMFIGPGGKTFVGATAQPLSYLGQMQGFIGMANDEAVSIADNYIKDLKEGHLFLDSIKDGEKIRRAAVAKRIRNYADEIRIDKPSDAKQYDIRASEIEREVNWTALKDKSYVITEGSGKDIIRVPRTGLELANRTNEHYDKTIEEVFKFISGDERGLDKWGGSNDKGVYELDHIQFIRDLEKTWQSEGSNQKMRNLWRSIGHDGLRRLSRSVMLTQVPDKEMRRKISREPVIETGRIGTQGFWPEMLHDRKSASKATKTALKKIMSKPESELSMEDKLKQATALMFRYRSLDGEWRFDDMAEWNKTEEIKQLVADKELKNEDIIKYFNAEASSGHLKERKAHLPGFTVDASAMEVYVRGVVKSYFRQVGQLFGRVKLDDMEHKMYKDKNYTPEMRKSWVTFHKLYLQDAIGNPSVIPKDVYADPAMHLKHSPYGWWSDNNVKNKINKVLKGLGMTEKDLPEELQGINFETLRNLSNLEAQYELASLLTHTRTIANNIFGGTTHTVSSAGLSNFKDGKSIKFLTGINPEWKNMKDIDNFVIGQGVYPDYIISEFGMHKEWQNQRNKMFIDELAKKMTRHPNMSKESVTQLAKKHGAWDAVTNFAAKFMTVPERAIRRDAFMAHYVQAWKRFGGAFPRYDHPYIIKLAKKGVQATQFLYSAPYRPAFARTALGKVMTRFQLWAWNAVRFRNEVYKEAKIHGFTPGTDSFEKLKRTMSIDLFVIMLANVFPYSIFDNALPAPYNWMQDTAQWLFGDEEERNKAFFGTYPRPIAPLQMISPPILRAPAQAFTMLLNDDFSKFSSRVVWPLFPFGRMGKDIFGKHNVIENPMSVMEKTMGFPLRQLNKRMKGIREGEYQSLYPGSYKKRIREEEQV